MSNLPGVRLALALSLFTLLNPSSGTVSGGNFWFDPSDFSIARLKAANTPGGALTNYPYGTFPRNGLRGPGNINLDLSISKHFFVTEKANIELRGDALTC